MSLHQKNIALILGFVFLFWMAYQFSLSNTFVLKKQYTELRKEKILFSNISQKLMQLKQQNQYYDSILKSKKIATESSFQNNLLQTISSFADTTNIKIVSFKNPHIFKIDNAIVNTYSFTINGYFSKITQLIYQLEQQSKLGKVISIHFEKKKNYRRNSYFLECTILLQRIESS